MPATLLNPETGGDARLHLPQVTLVAASSVALQATIRALRLSMAQVRFGAALLLCDRAPTSQLPPELEWRKIDPLHSRTAYSQFMMHELKHHVETDFVLCVQWDGYVLDASRWNDDFLTCDYVGAPWPHFDDEARVGNGGFSLRSKRLLEVSGNLPLPYGLAEDVAICRHYRTLLETEHSIRFAPENLARRFSHERLPETGEEFGFHGVFNMMDSLDAAQFAAILKTLEPGVLGRLESTEIMIAAAKGLRPATLWHAWRKRTRANPA